MKVEIRECFAYQFAAATVIISGLLIVLSISGDRKKPRQNLTPTEMEYQLKNNLVNQGKAEYYLDDEEKVHFRMKADPPETNPPGAMGWVRKETNDAE